MVIDGNPPLKQPHTSAFQASAPRHPQTRRIVTAGDSDTDQNQASYKKNRLPYRSFFILGNTPILSSAEIESVLARQGIAVAWEALSEEAAIVATDKLFDAKALLATLGGTIKIGIMLPPDITTEQWVRSRKTDGPPMASLARGGRIVVGVSVYKSATGVSNAKCDETLRTVRGEVLTYKRVLKEEGKAAAGEPRQGRALRLVTTRDRILPSVALVTEHMLERGGELVVFLSNNGEMQYGETNAVQAFHAYRSRDMGRPSRDALRGMLPQKVAQMMVNIAGVKKGGVICDPFCGSGTVLSEAALLGYNIVGSDISEEAIADTQKNFQFLISNFQQNSKSQIPNSNFFVSDVRSLSEHLAPASVDAIVTEPYLGPPLTGKESTVLLGKTRRDIHTLVADAFQSFAKVLRPKGRVVMVFPVLGGELLPIDDILKSGWRLVSLLPPVIAIPTAVGRSNLTPRNTILYSRADQHLAREITIWTRT